MKIIDSGLSRTLCCARSFASGILYFFLTIPLTAVNNLHTVLCYNFYSSEYNFKQICHLNLSKTCLQQIFVIKTHRKSPGVIKLFFDKVCSPKSETPTHLYKGFSVLKKWMIWPFFETFANRDLFWGVFLPQNQLQLILHFSCNFGKMGPSSKVFLTKIGPLSKEVW